MNNWEEEFDKQFQHSETCSNEYFNTKEVICYCNIEPIKEFIKKIRNKDKEELIKMLSWWEDDENIENLKNPIKEYYKKRATN